MSNIVNRKSLLSEYEEESPKRLVSAPTLYCVFALGTILIMVGTFITAHAYLSHHDSDYHLNVEHILRILGPILLGCGGVILLGISATCLCVYKRNKTIRHIVTAEDFCNIGASTFYDQRHVLSDTIDLINSSANGQIENGIDNLSQPTTQDDPITFLTKAVLHERRRKLSKNIPQVRNIQAFEEETSSNSSPVSASHLRDFHKRNPSPKRSIPLKAHPLDYIELQNLKRAIPHESLAPSDDGDDGNESPQPESRQRFFSMTGQRSQFRKAENFENHRRIASLTQSARVAHIEEIRRRRKKNLVNQGNQKIVYPPELSQSLSLKKKKKKDNNSASGENDQPEVHHLPGYSPEVIESLIEIADKQDFRKPLQINAKSVFSSLQHRNQLNTNETRNITQNNEISDKKINIKGSINHHRRGDFVRVNRNSDDLPSVEDYESQPYNIDGSSVDLRQKSRSAIRNSEANFERNSLGVQTLKRNFENISRKSRVSFQEFDDQVNNSHETRTKSSKDMLNIKLQTNVDGQKRCSHTVVENPASRPPSPASGSDSSCSVCSSPPPSPTKASFTALNIMQDLCQETPLPQRTQKTLSIISSQDEYYETD